ncbi:MAG TPA: GNAT family protein [Candidatus Dormibacteraeota bacterium]
MSVEQQLRIRACSAGDVEVFARYRADPVSATLTFGAVRTPETAEDVARFVETVNASGHLWIWADASDRAVGFSVLRSIDRLNRTLWTGSGIFEPDQRGRGLGSLGRRLVLDLVFNEMDYRRIYGEFGSFNEASRRSHLKMGAEIVGVRRQVYFSSGVYHDAVVYTVARERFNALFPPDPRRHLEVRR